MRAGDEPVDVGAQFMKKSFRSGEGDRLTDPAGRNPQIDTMRGLACVLLVLFHLIGSSPDSGLKVDFPHGLRVLNASLIDIRMPLFAFIAGYVYALRPATPDSWTAFVAGKARRLLVPGLVGITVYLVVSNLAGTSMGYPLADSWKAYVYGYAHFWFLKSIFVLLVLYSVYDILTQRRFAIPALGLAFAAALMVSSRGRDVFGLLGAAQLAPHFVLGVIACREFPSARLTRGTAFLVLAVFIGAIATLKLREFGQYGVISTDRTSVSALILGQAACLVAFLALPRIGPLIWLAPFTFTIYIYHAMTVTAFRQFLQSLGVESFAIHIPLTLAVGLMVPVAMHMICARQNLLRRWVLGLRPRTGLPSAKAAGI